MKKLSKILVVLLTLAMLLGVIVISASADTEADITYTVGGETLEVDADNNPWTLPSAIAAANLDESDEEIIITLNNDVTLEANDFMSLTRSSGKIVIDLNGNTLDASAVVHSFTYTEGYLASGYSVERNSVYVKESAGAEAKEYFMTNLKVLGYEEGETDTTAADITEFTAGATYIGSVTAGSLAPTNTGYYGVFHIEGNVKLDIIGNGGTIKNTSAQNCTFFITDEATGAELNVKDLVATKNPSGQAPFAYLRAGSTELENVQLTSAGQGYLFRHANDAELTVKDSVIKQLRSGSISNGILASASTSRALPADGYHIEFNNCLIRNSGTAVFYVAYPSSVGYGGTSVQGKTARTALDYRIKGEEYVNVAIKAESCNIDCTNYYSAGTKYGSILTTFATMQTLFDKCNIFVSHAGVSTGSGTALANRGTVTFNQSYIEITGKGMIDNDAPDVCLVDRYTTLYTYFRDTEIRLGELIKAKANEDGVIYNMSTTKDADGKYLPSETPITDTLLPADNAFFDAGCIIDKYLAPAIRTSQIISEYGGIGRLSNGDACITGIRSEDINSDFDTILHLNDLDLESVYVKDPVGPLTALSYNNEICDAGIGNSTTNVGRNNTRQITANIDKIFGSGSSTTHHGDTYLALEENGNTYYCYDPTYVHYTDGLLIANPAETNSHYVANCNANHSHSHWEHYIPADENGIISWYELKNSDDTARIAVPSSVYEAEGYTLPEGYTAINTTAYSYNHLAAATAAGVTDENIAKAAKGGWDIDSDGIIEYVDVDGTVDADGFCKPDLVNIPAKATGDGQNNDAAYCNTVIPEYYTNYGKAGEGKYLYMGADKSNTPKDLGTYSYITLSFDYMNAPGSSKFAPIQLGIQTNSYYNHFKIDENGDFNWVNGTSSDHLFISGNKTNEKALKLNQWNTITIVLEITAREDNTNYADTVSAYWFVNGELLAVTNAIKDSTVDIYSFRGSAIIRSSFQAADLTPDMRLCFDNVSTRWFKGEYENGQLTKALNGEEGALLGWTDGFDYYKSLALTPEDLEYDAAASITWTPTGGSGYAGGSYFDSCNVKGGEKPTPFYAPYRTFAGAVAGFTQGTYITLNSDVERVEINEPITVATEGNTFTYFSKTHKATLSSSGSSVSFAPATPDDMVTVTVDYADGKAPASDTFVNGSYFWYDSGRLKGEITYDEAKAQKLTLMANGEAVDDISKDIKLSGDTETVFSYDVHQFGWAIYAEDGSVLNYETDFGDDWTALDDRIAAIEKLVNPLENDESIVDYDLETGKLDPSFFVETLTTQSYTIKLFADMNATGKTIHFYGLAEKDIVVDLNGHTITSDRTMFFATAINLIWCLDENGRVYNTAGTKYDGSEPPAATHTTVTEDNEADWKQVLKYDISISIISSEEGGTLYITAKGSADTRAPVRSTTNARTYVYLNDTIMCDFSYASSRVFIGTTDDMRTVGKDGYANMNVDKTGIGHKENPITVIGPTLFTTAGSSNHTYIYNVNAFVSDSHALRGLGGNSYIFNSTVSSGETDGEGLIYVTTPKKFDAQNCNFVSTSGIPNLFSKVGYDGGTNYCIVKNSRIINMTLSSFNAPTKGNGAAIQLGCYYTELYEADKANYVFLSSTNDCLTTLTANVRVNETCEINGVTYLLKYKVVDASEITTVTWYDLNGNAIGDPENYVIGGNPVYEGVKVFPNDRISNNVIKFENLGTVTEDAKYYATLDRIVPAFTVNHNLNLYTNLYHNIKIAKYVNGVDILEFVTEIKIGETVVYSMGAENNLLATNDGGTPDNDSDDFYFVTVFVKSNEIADGYDIKVSFNTETPEDGVQVATISTSVLDYIEYGLGAEEEGSDLHNLFVSLVHYGSSAYGNFGGSAEGAQILAALAEKYPMDEAITGGDATASGDAFDVEFVLDSTLAYRFYITHADAGYSWAKVTYTDILGNEHTKEYNGYAFDEVKGLYYFDFTLPAYEFNKTDITVTLMNGNAPIEGASAVYGIADYYAEIEGGSNEALKYLVKSLNSYATYANLYVSSELGN